MPTGHHKQGQTQTKIGFNKIPHLKTSRALLACTLVLSSLLSQSILFAIQPEAFTASAFTLANTQKYPYKAAIDPKNSTELKSLSPKHSHDLPHSKLQLSNHQYWLYQDGVPIGTVSVSQQQTNDGTALEIQSRNHFQRDGEVFETGWNSRFIEPIAYQAPIQFDYSSHLGDSNLIRVSGAIDKNTQTLTLNPTVKNSIADNKSQTENITSISLDKNLPFVLPESKSQQALFSEHLKDHNSFQFQTLELGTAPRLVTSQATRLSKGECTQNSAQKDLKQSPCFRVENPDNRNSAMIEWRNQKGELLHAKSLNDNTELVYGLAATSSGVSSDNVPDINRRFRIASNYIPHPRQTTQAQYRISTLHKTGAQTLSLSQWFPQDNAQNIIKQDDDSITLLVKTDETLKGQQTFPINGNEAYLTNSSLIQSTDPPIQQTAKSIIGKELRAIGAASLLRQWVSDNIKIKNYAYGFSSASDVLQTKAGDCTEHAVLLTALLRSLGIPARVAIGLLYEPSDTGSTANTGMGYWVYHMWTEAQVGIMPSGNPIWLSLDASQPINHDKPQLDQSGMDAAHLKITDSALSSVDDLIQISSRMNQSLGQLRIDVLNSFSANQSVYNIRNSNGPKIPIFTLSKDESLGSENTTSNQADAIQLFKAQAIPPQKIDLTTEETLANTKAKEREYRVAALPQTLIRKTPEGAFQTGVEALSKNQYEYAIEAFHDAIMQHRGNEVALMQMARRLISIEMYREAKDAFNLASTSSRLNWQTIIPWADGLSETSQQQYQEAIYREKQGKTQEAIQAFQSVLSSNPNLAPAYGHLGTLRNDWSDYQKYQQLASADPRADMALGEIALKQKQYQVAARWWESAEQKIATQNGFWEGSKNDILAKKEIATALAALQQNRAQGNAWVQLGHGYQKLGSLSEAQSAYQQALRYRPGNAQANAALLQLAIAQNHWPKAAQYAGRLTGSGSIEALTALGYYKMRQRDYGSTISLLKLANQKSSASADATRYLSEAYQRRYDLYRNPSDFKQAFAVLAQGIANSQNEKRAALEKAFINAVLSPPMRFKESPEQTEPYYQQALQYANQLVDNDWFGNDFNSRVLQGRLLTLLKQYDDAHKILETVLAISPYDIDALAAMGYLAEAEESTTQAMGYYQQVLKQDPENFIANQGLHSVMIQEEMSFKRPRAYWQLSPDEFDFLRLWMQAEAQWLNRQYTMLQQAQSMLSHYGQVGTLKAQAEREELFHLLWGEEQWEKSAYNRFKAIPTPKRLAQFRFFALEHQFTSIEWLMAQHAFAPNYTSLSMPQKQQMMAEQMIQGLNNMSFTGKRYFDYIKQQLPITMDDWDRVMLASGNHSTANYGQLWQKAITGYGTFNNSILSSLKGLKQLPTIPQTPSSQPAQPSPIIPKSNRGTPPPSASQFAPTDSLKKLNSIIPH